MTTPCHMILTAAFTGGTMKALGSRRSVRFWWMGVFGTLASLPDLLTWIWHIAMDSDRWFYHAAFHSWWMVFIPPAGLHVWMDSWVHLPGGGIMPLYYVLEVLFWLVSLPILYWSIRK